jgi:hypothetical protein
MFYGWTPAFALSMPARQFFAMLESGRKLKQAERVDACDIAAIPVGGAEYQKKLKASFLQVSEEELLPSKSGQEAIDGLKAMFGVKG